mmetsp:Transcript_19733/g.54319  ORF Transcript_19733/g.54319 Transcript_19733/m.54319 type:complete len:233 (+) Transcript_19733:1648-2346(+)
MVGGCHAVNGNTHRFLGERHRFLCRVQIHERWFLVVHIHQLRIAIVIVGCRIHWCGFLRRHFTLHGGSTVVVSGVGIRGTHKTSAQETNAPISSATKGANENGPEKKEDGHNDTAGEQSDQVLVRITRISFQQGQHIVTTTHANGHFIGSHESFGFQKGRHCGQVLHHRKGAVGQLHFLEELIGITLINFGNRRHGFVVVVAAALGRSPQQLLKKLSRVVVVVRLALLSSRM